jgi:hypothetical protein
MNNVIELKAKRDGPQQKLFDTHRLALTELIIAYALHSEETADPNGDFDAAITRLYDAQESFCAAWLALQKAAGQRQ